MSTDIQKPLYYARLHLKQVQNIEQALVSQLIKCPRYPRTSWCSQEALGYNSLFLLHYTHFCIL